MNRSDLSVGAYGDEVADLHQKLLTLGVEIPASELERRFFGPATRDALLRLQADHRLKMSGSLDDQTRTVLDTTVSAHERLSNRPIAPQPTETPSFTLPDSKPLNDFAVIHETEPLEIVDLNISGGDVKSYQVEGRVASRISTGVGDLRVVIVDKGIGGDVQLAQATTDEGGVYQASFSDSDLRGRGKEQPDLQARVFAGDTFLGASEVHYNASQHEILNTLLEDKVALTLRSEHEVLTSALVSRFKGRLGDLKETDDQQDITYLANKSGWDARAVALAALADQFSAQTADASGAPTIPQAYFYALFRAGLPANEDTLYHTDAKTLEAVWKTAAEQGVIPGASLDQIPNMVGQFQDLSAQKLLTGPALVGASSLKEMLTISHLNDAQQAQFAQLYTANRTDMPAFWKEVTNAFGQDLANRLQVDGKLGFLTINNAPLMQKVQTTAGEHGFSDLLQLAQMGYHRAEPWSQLLTDDIPIPKEIPGDTPEIKQKNYADYLAAQVRLSYPTAAVAQMVRSGELPLTGAADGVADRVHAFLTQHQGRFEIGMQPVQHYIAQNNLQVADETVNQVKRLQRVCQITPSDQAMIGLMKRGIDAAYHVVRYDKETFVQSFAADLGGQDHAVQTYDKSVQVHNVVLNIALSYLNAHTAPEIGGRGLLSILNPAPAHVGDVIPYATLESLFGSMDFCACDHCRSILSPAAYLVDLLLFLHGDEQEWKAYCDLWRKDHGGAPYPFPNQDAFSGADQPQNMEISPLSVLLSRRPDIEHLPLTCENTNTALPYIDVVNETLEYFIANSIRKLSLNGYLGHDTNNVASEDLLASPQFVMDSAYVTLRDERFPAPLPFSQPLESLRRYFDKFEISLPVAMERLRRTDDLERGANPFSWRDILIEELCLSRAEHEILTDSTAVPLCRMYGFPNGTSDADVIADLSNAKEFTRRLGVSYDEIVEILRTRFVNPNSDLVPKLERLSIPFVLLKALKDGSITDAAFDALLPTGILAPDPAEYGGDIKAWVKQQDNYDRVMGIITLADPKANPDPCSFDNLEFRFSKPVAGVDDTSTRLGPVEFVRMLRFIRMWKKLGWTIEQTDASICALYCADLAPLGASDVDSIANLDTGFLTLLPRLGIVFRVIKVLNLTVKRDLLPLLTCWSEIGTHGDTALYRQMFLNSALLKQDPVFADNGYGDFLRDDTQKLLAHAEALRSAFNLTGDEFDLIINALGYNTVVEVEYTHPQNTLEQSILNVGSGIGYDKERKKLSYTGFLSADMRDALKSVGNAIPSFPGAVDDLYQANQAALRPLTLTDISAIFRRAWLARTLKISVRELLLLVQLTGLDPFVIPDPTNPAIMRIISLVQALKDRALKSAAALYLIWNQDLSGKSAPDPAQLAAFARTLRLGFAAVETEFTVADDPDGAIAQAQVAKVYGADAANFFFGLLNNTLTVGVEFGDPDGTLTLDAVRQAIETAGGKTDVGVPRIAYDDFRKWLTYSGVLTVTTREAIKSAAGAEAAVFKAAVDDLYTKNQDVINPFFARYPELQYPHDTYVADVIHLAAEKRGNLLKAILPGLVKRQKRQQALQAVSAVTNTDLALTQVFLDSPTPPFPLHAVGDISQPALNDLLALETTGLSVQFFANDTSTGAIIPFADITSDLDYAPAVRGDGNPLPANPTPTAPISGIWRGYLEAPESGFFNFRIMADNGATVTLILDGRPVNLTQKAEFWDNTDLIELRAGTLHSINLKIEKVRNAGRVQWEWEPKGQGCTVIPAHYLYPAVLFEAFKETYVRFLKAASLSIALGLTANELAYFATHSDYHINTDGWLNNLPGSAEPAPGTVTALLKPLEALLEFARIKGEISPSDESLVAVLEDPVTATQNTDSLLFSITRWNQTSLNDVLAWFSGNVAGLGHFDLFRRVFDAFALSQKMGISAKALIQATTNGPTADTVRNLQAALRARYDPASWRDVVRPINDEMRSLQRDALVAYILHQMRSHPESKHIDTPDKLFEYFLMDVQMDPCMQTSRIRHALSSVQLFIERCLMNLEPRVSPAAINANQWEWMKRYRVWEANRKVYLFPENWLEPELRDDKSPFFKEIESELLQSDITEERAATALLNYLSKLEEVAKLEPCGIFHIPANPSQRTGEINHVVARTAGASRKYYYRRYEYGYWTPWEQVKLDIEDNPVIPVVWRDRLFLFWLRILKQVSDTVQKPFSRDGALTSLTTSDIRTDSPRVRVQAVLCWSEYYNGKWQLTKTSDINRPTELGSYNSTGESSFNRSLLQLGAYKEEDGLRVVLFLPNGYTYSSFLLYNTHSLPVREEDGLSTANQGAEHLRFLDLGLWRAKGTFAIGYRREKDTLGFDLERDVLLGIKRQIPYRTVGPFHVLQNEWAAPFFYEDSCHVFYVTTAEQLVPVSQWNDYAIYVAPPNISLDIPPLVFEPKTIVPDLVGPIISQPGFGVIDPTPVERYVTEDAFIHQTIGLSGTVRYGDTEIGLTGSQIKSMRTR